MPESYIPGDGMVMHSIGIRREDKNAFERRTPLTPEHVEELRLRHQLPITLQPAPRRIFSDEEYQKRGASINESLDACSVILGVKEIPLDQLSAGKTYVFFSHTIKAQPYNMPLLHRLLELGCTLIDYEKIIDASGQRLVFFGPHAGLAGMIDTLWALGQRLALEGYLTPLAKVKPAYQYSSLTAAKEEITRIGQALQEQGLPPAIRPLVFGVTGYGNVSRGAQEILDLLAPQTIPAAALLQLDHTPADLIYKVVFHEQDLVEPVQGSFELQDYYAHPDRYRSIFSRYLDQLSVIVNCIYWEVRYPRLVTVSDLTARYGHGQQPRLRVIGDISCDVNGSIEVTTRATTSDNPVFVFDVESGQAIDGVNGLGPVIMAVDNLPAELPQEASASFSRALLPFIPALAAADFTGTLARSGLPDELRRAVISYRGELTADFSYLANHLA